MLVNFNFKLLYVCIVILFIFIGDQSLSQDWSSVLKEAKEKDAKFQADVKDLAIVLEMKIYETKDKQARDKIESKIYKKSDKFRVESKMPMPGMDENMKEMETVFIFDGKENWIIAPFAGKQKVSVKEAKQYNTSSDWWELVSENAKIISSEKVDGKDCYVVVATEKENPTFDKMWIDKKNIVLVKSESKDDKGVKTQMVYSDFRKIKGDWEMAYKTDVYHNGKLISTSIIKSLGINKGLTDDLFNPGKVKAKEMNMQEMMKKMMEKDSKDEKND